MRNHLFRSLFVSLFSLAAMSASSAEAQSVGCFIVNGGAGCYEGALSCYDNDTDNTAAYGAAVSDLCKRLRASETDKSILSFSQTTLQSQVTALEKEKLTLQTTLNVVDDALDEFPAIKKKYKASAAITQALAGNYAPILNIITTLSKALDAANTKIKKLTRK